MVFPFLEKSSLASVGKLKLVLLLELPLLLPEEDRPLIPPENEALRGETGGEGGGSTLTGDWRTGELTPELFPPSSKLGISDTIEEGEAEM